MAVYNAVFRIDQDRPGGPSVGEPGISRRDIWLDNVVHLVPHSPPTAAGTTYWWEFLDRPAGSTAQLLDETTGLPSQSSKLVKFTPDAWGTYRLSLTINKGQYVHIMLAAAILTPRGATMNRGWRLPAFKETDTEGNFTGQLRGYADDWDFILIDILNNAFGGGGGTQVGVYEHGALLLDPVRWLDFGGDLNVCVDEVDPTKVNVGVTVGAVTFGGDLEELEPGTQTVIGIQTTPVSTTTPSESYQVLAAIDIGAGAFEYRPVKLTQDMIDPAFTISGFSCTSHAALQEQGATVTTPAFAATYTTPPGGPNVSASFWSTDFPLPVAVPLPALVINDVNSYTKSTQVTQYFYLEANRDGFSKQRSASITWTRKRYWFAAGSPGPGGYTQLWLETLVGVNSELATSRLKNNFLISVGTPADNKHAYYIYKSDYGAGTFWVGGFAGGFNLVDTIHLTNVHGVDETFYVYESTQVGLGDIYLTVT